MTKIAAQVHLPSSQPVYLMGDVFRFQYSTNKGAFLGLGARLPDSVRFWSLTILVSIVLVGMLGFVWASQELSHPMSILGVSLIIGGGFSNLIDRLLNDGAAVDFMNIGVGNLRTGIFNLADVAIVTGTGILLAWSLFFRRVGKTNPSQHSLDAMFDKVTRVRVLNGGVSGGKALGKEVLLDGADTESIATLRDCLAIVEDPSTFGHCMCLGDYALQFFAGWRRIATVGLHHGRSIRWDAWRHDALLQDGRQLLTWLADRGATAPLEAFEEDQRRAEEYRQATARWQQAMPACLRPYWDQMQASAGNMAVFVPVPQVGEGHPGQAEASASGMTPLLQALETEYPDPETRVLELFKWYGSGKGPWSGFPSYESVAETLLLEFPTSQLVTALARHPLTPIHLEGAARYFAGYTFNTQKQDEAQQIPRELKQRLLTHSLMSSDEDKIRRAKKAFTGQDDGQ